MGGAGVGCVSAGAPPASIPEVRAPPGLGWIALRAARAYTFSARPHTQFRGPGLAWIALRRRAHKPRAGPASSASDAALPAAAHGPPWLAAGRPVRMDLSDCFRGTRRAAKLRPATHTDLCADTSMTDGPLAPAGQASVADAAPSPAG